VTVLSGIEAVPYDFDLVRACSNWFSGLGAGASSRESGGYHQQNSHDHAHA